MSEPKEKNKHRIYKGEIHCEGHTRNNSPCTRLAYYDCDGVYCCGVHSKEYSHRREMNKNPHAELNKKNFLKEQEMLVEAAANDNFSKGVSGSVLCGKMRRMKKVPHVNGYLNVYPNFWDGNRKDGFGCNQLSPMSLGPIFHKQENLPPATCLENFHQSNKVFAIEYDSIRKEVMPIFFQKQKEMYADHVPHRHKYPRNTLKNSLPNSNINIPLFSLIYDSVEKCYRRYTYIQSRYFYCHYYELLAKKTEQFHALVEKITKGFNLCILGYDGYDLTSLPGESTVDMFYRFYVDDSRPFGHELVLCSLLILKDSSLYPWNKYYQEHREIYTNVV